MIIKNLIHGKFVERPNRFIVVFEIGNGSTDIAHLRDPGRLKELLIPGVKLLLSFLSIENYKYNFDPNKLWYKPPQ